MLDGQYKSRLSQIISSWRATGKPNTRAALHENPDMRSKGAIMDLVLAEYKMRRDSGEPLMVTRFCDQFSTFRDELRELLHVEDGISKIERQQVEWPQPGETFLEFELQSILGIGAASRVYLARQTTLGNRLVALKITPFGSSEAQTLGKLRHRNVVPVLSIHDDPQRELWAVCMPYLGSATLLDVRNHAFEHSEGPQAASVILEAAATEGASEVKQAIPPAVLRNGRYYEGIAYVGAELAEGLAYTHSQGVLHRDLKPSNVLITADGCAMLLDFNLAWDSQRESFRLGGTVPYMPPEQLYATFLADEDEPPTDDPRSDVFALGVILFELLTGRLPFLINERAELADTVDELMRQQLRGATRVRELAPGVPRRLAKLVDQCLVVEVSGRPHPARLAEQLRRYGIRPKFRGKRSTAVVVALVAVAVLLTGAAAFGGWSLLARAGSEQRVVDTREEYLQLALELMNRNDFEAAAEKFRTANEMRPHWTVAAHLAYCRCRMDVSFPPKTVFFDLVKERRSDPDILNNYAHLLMINNDSTNARLRLEEALAIQPDHAHALFNRAVLNYRSSDHDFDAGEAVDSIQRAITQFESRSYTLHLMAAFIVNRGQQLGKLEESEALDLLRHHLTEAVACGCPRSALQDLFSAVSDQSWYTHLLQIAAEESGPEVDLLDYFYCKPKYSPE